MPQPDILGRNGTTDIDVVIVREGKTFKGKVLGLVLGTIGRSFLKKAFQNSVKAIVVRTARLERQANHEPGSLTAVGGASNG